MSYLTDLRKTVRSQERCKTPGMKIRSGGKGRGLATGGGYGPIGGGFGAGFGRGRGRGRGRGFGPWQQVKDVVGG